LLIAAGLTVVVLDFVAYTLAVFAGFALVVMLTLIIGHYLSPEPRWAFTYEQRSRTKEYVWLSLVFFSHACFMLFGIQFLDMSAMTAFLAPLLVWPLVYLTFPGGPKRAWAVAVAWLVLIADLALSTTLVYGWRQSTAFWISVMSLWIFSLFIVLPELRSELRGFTICEPLFSAFDRALSKATKTVIGKTNALDVLALAVVAFPIVAVLITAPNLGVNWPVISSFLIWIALLSSGVPAVAHALQRPLVRTSSAMWRRRPEKWNRAAYFSVGFTVLLLAGVVPAAGVFNEMFHIQMDNLTRYGQAYLVDAYKERYRTLQADVARIDPAQYAKAGAEPIKVEPDDIGVYAWRTRLFPSDQPSTIGLWYAPPLRNTSQLYGTASFGQPVECGNDGIGNWALTAWVASRVPGLNTTTAQLRQFSLLPGQDPAGRNCRELADEEPIAMQPISVWPSRALVWLGVAMLIIVGAAGLWFMIRLAAKRFLACAIDHPRENWNAGKDQSMARLAADIQPGLHLLIGLPGSQLDAFKQALQVNSISIESCIENLVYEADRGSDNWFKSTVLILTDMHLALGSDKQLTRLLAFLEERNAKKLTTVVLSDVDPLDAITHPDHYAHFSDRKSNSDTEEVARWIRLFNKSFIQYLREYHRPRNDDALARETYAFVDLERLDAQIRPLWREGKLTDGEMVERVGRHARGFYESLWRLCSNTERVILYRLAQGYLINPANAHDLVHLLEIGILRRDPAIRLPNESIKRFILSAESPERIEVWASDAKTSTWSIVRIPLVGLILVLTMVISFMGKETTDYVLGLLGVIAALLPLVSRAFGSMGEAKPNSGSVPSSS
jgi:hypothetical protein